ncbi:hypothetical protein K439DRAFT_1638070 [Ramaria rubella]|nr:hypothetical protein K439DRAFT_1638070 [Ramaria rubella]
MEGLDEPSISEFLQHPSYHQVATFFLGFVFITCIHFTIHIPHAIVRRVRLSIQGHRATPLGGVGLEANRQFGDEKVHGWLGSNRSHHTSSSFPIRPESNTLALSLTICFGMASVANFGSLLEFSQKNGLAGCAFLVAWGGMAAQSGRILGLLKLSLDLRKLGVHRWESFLFWGWLVVAMVVMFVTNAISVGFISAIPGPRSHSALCYRKHFLGTAVVSSAIDIVLEIYCLLRVYSLVAPAFLSPRHRFDALMDIRISRALSLLILDLATAVPAAHFFNILADFIPDSLCSLIVLAAFNQKSPDVTLASTASIPGTRPGSMQSRSTIEIQKMPSCRSLVEPQQRVSHPFAAKALQDPSPETEDWPESASPQADEKPYLPFPEPAAVAKTQRPKRQTWRASNHSAVSECDSELARSVKGAVVGFAFKDVVTSGRRPRDHSFLPPMPTSTRETPSEVREEIFSRAVPLRIPKPIPLPPRVEPLERASRSERDNRPPSNIPSLTDSAPSIAVQTASPVSPSVPRSAGSKPSISITVPTGNNSTKSSLHLTPSTPAQSQSQPSRRTSSDSDWRYDSRHESFSSHRSSDEASPTQAQRHSGTSSRLPPADDDLSIVYEASHEDSDSLPPSRAYRPAFEEHMFVEGGIGRPISTPVGVPEDVQEGGQSNGSQSSGSSKPRRPST